MDYATKSDLLEAVFAAVLKRAAENFPVRGGISPETIAKDVGVEFKTDDRPGYGRKTEFPECFGQKFDSIVRATVLWLGESDYLFLDPGSPAALATLSERGARLMNCLPKCLGE